MAKKSKSHVDSVIGECLRTNNSSSRYEASFAGHREHFTRVVLGTAPPTHQGKLCLLGAGNCQDLELRALVEAFSEIHLVDLDRTALSRAIEKLPAGMRRRVYAHAPVDLSGCLDKLESWRKNLPLQVTLEAASASAMSKLTQVLATGDFDSVVSCCLVTQVSLSLTRILGSDYPLLSDIRRMSLTTHFRSMAALLRPGGRAIFATDISSNDTYPLDALTADSDMHAVLVELQRTGNHFWGADPLLIANLLREDPSLVGKISPARILQPWLWENGPERIFLVAAWAFERVYSFAG